MRRLVVPGFHQAGRFGHSVLQATQQGLQPVLLALLRKQHCREIFKQSLLLGELDFQFLYSCVELVQVGHVPAIVRQLGPAKHR